MGAGEGGVGFGRPSMAGLTLPVNVIGVRSVTAGYITDICVITGCNRLQPAVTGCNRL